jgi:hypothetical protein
MALSNNATLEKLSRRSFSPVMFLRNAWAPNSQKTGSGDSCRRWQLLMLVDIAVAPGGSSQ